MKPRIAPTAVATLVLLLGSVVGLQALRARQPLPARLEAIDGSAPYVQSPAFVKRAVLAYDMLAADVYWMRALQQYGRTKLSKDPNKRYDFLYPLLDLTTSLDPDFEIAYRFGAIFLAEPYPGGAGRADLALSLLEKGMAAHPTAWEYAQDIAFVHYWSRRDYVSAADWFKRAAQLPGSPNWLEPMAAVTLTEGGNRNAARRLWQQVFDNAEAGWLMEQAQFRLSQLDAMDQIDALEQIVKVYERRHARLPQAWSDVVGDGLLPGIPLDPQRFPYQLNPYWGTVTLAAASTLQPLPTAGQRPR